MKAYFKRLKEHPGLSYATLFTVLGGFAGGINKSFENPFHGILFGVIGMGLICWGGVLISNFKSE